MDWDDVPEAFMISVLNFVYDASVDDGFLEYTMRLEDGKNLKSARMKIIYLELPKYEDVPDYPIEKLTSVEKWAKFFLYSNRKEKQEYLRLLAETEAGIMNAQESLDSISQSEAEWIRETAYWDAVSNRKTIIGTAERRGLKQGMEKGLQQGIQQTKIETARNLKNNGVSIEIIAKSLCMPLEQVKRILNSDETVI